MGGGNDEGVVARQGMKQYYETKLRELDVVVQTKEANLKRLEAQRNELNGRGMENPPASSLPFPSLFSPSFFFLVPFPSS